MHTVAGGIFGGTAVAMTRWHKVYYSVLERYIRTDRFAGDDQCVMATICVLYPKLVTVVRSPRRMTTPKFMSTHMEPWVYLQKLLLPRHRTLLTGGKGYPSPNSVAGSGPVGFGSREREDGNSTVTAEGGLVGALQP
eukprot:RCo015165